MLRGMDLWRQMRFLTISCIITQYSPVSMHKDEAPPIRTSSDAASLNLRHRDGSLHSLTRSRSSAAARMCAAPQVIYKRPTFCQPGKLGCAPQTLAPYRGCGCCGSFSYATGVTFLYTDRVLRCCVSVHFAKRPPMSLLGGRRGL